MQLVPQFKVINFLMGRCLKKNLYINYLVIIET